MAGVLRTHNQTRSPLSAFGIRAYDGNMRLCLLIQQRQKPSTIELRQFQLLCHRLCFERYHGNDKLLLSNTPTAALHTNNNTPTVLRILELIIYYIGYKNKCKVLVRMMVRMKNDHTQSTDCSVNVDFVRSSTSLQIHF